MDIESFLESLKSTPVILKGNEVPLIYTDDNAVVIRDLQKLQEIIDSPEPTSEVQIVVIDKGQDNPWGFPEVEIYEDIFDEKLNYILCENYTNIQNKIFSQKDIAEFIKSNINFDVIVTIFVDGLSYLDSRNIPDVIPCLVNGPTLTQIGFQNIINNPPIVLRLFEKGIKNRLGFSYWDRTESLTDLVFQGFTPSQMNKVKEFGEIIATLDKIDMLDTYVQIVLEGYDQVCHRNRDRPMIDKYVERLFDKYIADLSNIIRGKSLNAIIYLTSDHGIWWKKNLGEKGIYKIINHPQATSKRYIQGNIIGEHLIKLSSYGTQYSVLEYPYVYSDYATNEWGTHGGISIYESFVPFYVKEVR